MTGTRIVAAAERDVPLILEMIRGLAEYERLSHLVTATEDHVGGLVTQVLGGWCHTNGTRVWFYQCDKLGIYDR